MSYETYKLRRLRGQDNLHVSTRHYARLRPADPRLREHSCSFTAIIALSCRKKRCSSHGAAFSDITANFMAVQPRQQKIAADISLPLHLVKVQGLAGGVRKAAGSHLRSFGLVSATWQIALQALCLSCNSYPGCSGFGSGYTGFNATHILPRQVIASCGSSRSPLWDLLLPGLGIPCLGNPYCIAFREYHPPRPEAWVV